MRALHFWTVIGVMAVIVGSMPAAPPVHAQWRQAVPFGPISALMGWTDISAASGLAHDVRFSRWHGGEPSPLIRLKRDAGKVFTEAVLWFGGDFTHPRHLPTGPDVRCDSRKEGPQTCVKPIEIPAGVVLPDIADLVEIRSCETEWLPPVNGLPQPIPAQPTHTLTLQMQIVDGRRPFRTYTCVGPSTEKGPGAQLSTRLLKILSDVGRAAGYQ
jgi:hypothetical protein